MKTSTETITRPVDPMLRKYCVDYSGTVHFIEAFASTGWYIAQRMDFKGTPLCSKLTAMKELSKMSLHSNLREARAAAAVAANKYAALQERFGR
jgi:phage terminase small subunit